MPLSVEKSLRAINTGVQALIASRLAPTSQKSTGLDLRDHRTNFLMNAQRQALRVMTIWLSH
jgi:hypothetical protein